MSNTRKLVKELNAGINREKNLPVYVEQSKRTYHQLAQLKLMMEYYMFYEMWEEGLNPYMKEAEEITGFVNHLIEKIYIGEISDEEAQTWLDKTHAMRKQIMEKMQVATSYVDMCIVFEYMLNRVQYRFQPVEEPLDDDALAEKIIRFIFGVKDNMVVNENIRTMIGQLPVRMTKSRYFDLVRNSLSVYKDGDVSSLDGYLYMFRTSALLYKPKGMDEHFSEVASLVEELSGLDYDGLTEEAYTLYSEKVQNAAGHLRDISDLYMCLQQMVNDLYTLLLNRNYRSYENDSKAPELVIEGIWRLLTENEGEFFTDEQGCVLTMNEEKLALIENYLTHTEGAQEQLYEKSILLEAMQQELAESAGEELSALGLSEDMKKLLLSSQLMSSSMFIDLEQGAGEQPVTAEYLKEQTDKLMQELENMFKEKGKQYRRAVMAATLEKMPVFFTSGEEVAEYVRTSLSMCTDASEKYAVQMLVDQLIEQ